MTGPPPGWYLETEDGQQGRYWDGHAWTDHVVEVPEGLTLQTHDDLHSDESYAELVEEPPRVRTVRIAAVAPFVVVLTTGAALLGAALSEPAAAPPEGARATTSAPNRSTIRPMPTTSGITTSSTSSTSSSTSTTVSSTTVSSTTPPSTTTLLRPAKMIDVSGTAPQTTDDFTVLIPTWDVRWSYDCGPSAAGGSDVFALSVVGQDPSSIPETIVKSSLPKAAGVVERTDGPSTFSLLVISSCKWQVEALTAP